MLLLISNGRILFCFPTDLCSENILELSVMPKDLDVLQMASIVLVKIPPGVRARARCVGL